MKNIVILFGVLVGAVILSASIAVTFVYPAWGWVLGPAILIVLAIAAKIETIAANGQCGHPYDKDPALTCTLPPGHVTGHAVSLDRLAQAGYIRPPF